MDIGPQKQKDAVTDELQPKVTLEPVDSPCCTLCCAIATVFCIFALLCMTKALRGIDRICPWVGCPHVKRYGYSPCDGPHTWAWGTGRRRQSPINIRLEQVQALDGCPPLLWAGYDSVPHHLTLTNDGTAAVLHGCWGQGHRGGAPTLSGGPLGETRWPFAWAEFHWGPSDEEGSEHTMDFSRYALELQLVHGPCRGRRHVYACVAVLFQACADDNPYLDPVVQALRCVVRAGCSCRLLPFPLDWLSPPVAQGYLGYSGSLTRPPCSEGVLWILRTYPLNISSRQVSEFRGLLGSNGRRLLQNTRPVQLPHGRPVCLYCD